MQAKVGQLGFYKAALAKITASRVKPVVQVLDYGQVSTGSPVELPTKPGIQGARLGEKYPENGNHCRACKCSCALKGGTTGGLERVAAGSFNGIHTNQTA